MLRLPRTAVNIPHHTPHTHTHTHTRARAHTHIHTQTRHQPRALSRNTHLFARGAVLDKFAVEAPLNALTNFGGPVQHEQHGAPPPSFGAGPRRRRVPPTYARNVACPRVHLCVCIVCMYVYVCVCMCMYVYVCVCMYIVYACMYVYKSICIYLYVCIHAHYLCVYINLHVCIYMYVYTHTHVCITDETAHDHATKTS